ncbi:uncharacterized protein WCC33_016796 [Rhinophrynus dorsalis]
MTPAAPISWLPPEAGILVIKECLTAPSVHQHNYTVYKFRYRWQKRILQIDFYSKKIFNIEKGNLKKQFPFAQIKSCENSEGLKFVILFYGHQDYELEASCLEDKESIMKIMNDIIESNRQASLLKWHEKKYAYSEVKLEGLLELLDTGPNSVTWVKYLVKLMEDELVFYCSQQTRNPVENRVILSDCSVTASTYKACPTFSVQSNGSTYTFRIPLNDQTKNPEDSLNMRDDWVYLLQKYGAQHQQSSPRQCEASSGINKSMWAQQNSDQKKINTERLMHQFQSLDIVTAIDTSLDPLKNQNILLHRTIAHNFNIVLKSFNFEPSQLKAKLLIIHECDGGLSDEHLTNLKRYVPTVADKNMYLSFKGSFSELHIVDQFMLEMCKIPDLNQRLDILLTIRELPTYMTDIQPLLSQKIKACYQLLTSQAFTAVLNYILSMGNYLNENAGKEKAKGFRLSSLIKMSQLASKAKRFTLLHALVEQILLQEPDLAKFSQELTEFEAVPGASVKGLNAEVDVIAKELEKVNQYRKSIKSKHQKGTASETQFLKDLKNVVEHYEAQRVELSKRANEMKKLYSDVLQKFGEDEDQDSQEFFGWICTFIKEFRNAFSAVRCTERDDILK